MARGSLPAQTPIVPQASFLAFDFVYRYLLELDKDIVALESAPPAPGIPGGSTTQVQFNDAGAFAGDAGLVYDKTTNTLTVGQLIDSGLTPSRLVASDASNQLASLAVTTTEAGYLAGVTSAIQTQLNAKLSGAGTATWVPFYTGAAVLSAVSSFTYNSGTSTLNLVNLAYSGTLVGTANSANALAVGRTGATNPAFQVDTSLGVDNGLKVTAGAAYGGPTLEVVSSVSDDILTIKAKGAGSVVFPGLCQFTAAPSLSAIWIAVSQVIVAPENLQITSLGPGIGWIDMPTTGASGIGAGYGANTWLGYCFGAGYWFADAAAGDIAYRNLSGALRFGTSSGNAAVSIIGDLVGVKIASPTSTLHCAGSLALSIVSKTKAYALTISDHTVLFSLSSASVAATLPAASSCVGRIYVIKKIDATAFTVTVTPAGADLIDGAATHVLTTQWQSVMIQSNGTHWYVI